MGHLYFFQFIVDSEDSGCLSHDKEDLESFCIIDDDDFYMWKWLLQFLVITRVRAKDERGYPDWQRTLSDADVERAIAILNRDNKAVIEEQF